VPEETKPAPRPLLLVQGFVNTWDGELRTDKLVEPAAARAWLAPAGLWTLRSEPPPAALQVARAVRESIRSLLVAHSGGPPATIRELEALNSLAQRTTVRVEVDPDGQLGLDAEDHGDHLDRNLARMLLIVRDAQSDGTWTRLRACRNPECQWAFYDRSHGRLGAWCDMAVCGNRDKNRRLRQRRA
jgi:predicted RNA-binding Zn ribbon-like protein